MKTGRGIGGFFGDLRVRLKLMVLHNIFFLILACAVYFSLIPPFEDRVNGARLRESNLARQMFTEDRPLLRVPGMEIYDYQEGSSQELSIPHEALAWLEAHPGGIWQSPSSDLLYRKEPVPGHYRRLRLPHQLYDEVLRRARLTLFIVLGAIYVLAVLILELLVMPLYVYRPLRLMLAADAATRLGDREHELIDPRFLSGDEIGQIMRSRNATVAELRRHEDRLQEVAEDLRRKNILLEAARQNIAEQDRLVSLGMLSASVAHELNTPLSVLRGSIEKLIETNVDPAGADRLHRMLRVTERLQKISETLVDFSRTRKEHSEPVPVRQLIEEAWSLVAIGERASGIRFHNAAGEQDVAFGNSDRLIQVFVNLLRNAAHAIQSSGNITVESRMMEDCGQPWVLISVEDDGPGIPPHVLPDIFEAFVSTRLDARGTGLGLSVAEGIVRQHNGTISASNRAGGGARLEVRLPAVPRKAAATAKRNG